MDEIPHGIVTTNTVSIRTASQTMFATQRDLDTAACRKKTAISLVGEKSFAPCGLSGAPLPLGRLLLGVGTL
jgi:hypothetical protein